MISNKAFFVPTIMFFIALFALILFIFVIQSITYTSNNKMYMQQAYEDSALIRSNYYIEESLNKEYEDVCKEDNFILNYGEYKLEIDPICFFNINTIYNNIIKGIFGNKKIEYNEDEYQQEIEKLTSFEDVQKIATNKALSKIIEFLKGELESIPESEVIIKIIEKKLDKNLEEYISFNITFKNKTKENNYLYYYNFKKKEKMKLIHT